MDTDFVDFTRFVCDSFLKTNILRSPGEVKVVRVWTSRGFCTIHFSRQNILQSSGGLNVSKKKTQQKKIDESIFGKNVAKYN